MFSTERSEHSHHQDPEQKSLHTGNFGEKKNISKLREALQSLFKVIFQTAGLWSFSTPPKFNSKKNLKNDGLEDYFPFGTAYLSGNQGLC